MFEDLDPKLINALNALRQEFDEKLSRQQESLPTPSGAPADSSIEQPMAEEIVAPLIAPEIDLLDELKLAAAEIDRSESQAEVLDSLIRGASRFSSRTAVFLHREDSLQGWGGTGFGTEDTTIKGLALEVAPESAWGQVTSGAGGIGLESDGCAVLTDRLDVDPAEVGVLIPFILQNQVAAVLYSDRLESGNALSVAGLQLLSFLAGLTVETLPVRGRASTNSLQLSVTPAGAAAIEPVVEPVVESVLDSDLDRAPEPEPEPVAETAILEEPAAEGLSEPSGAAEDLGLTAEAPAESMETFAEPLDAPDETADEMAAEWPTPPQPYVPEPEISEATAYEPDSIVEAPTYETEEPSDAGIADMGPAAAPGPPAALDTPDEDGTSPGITAPAPEPPPAPAPLPERPVEPAGIGSTQVQPPQDVEGPGWAFTTTKIPTSAGAEAVHEEARRLARLLVTEIKLYNEELVEEGRLAGNVFSRLREDIDRSRQIFDDRIDPEIRSEKDYFHEALVRILAGGDPAILGA